jgi:hypothetical protein
MGAAAPWRPTATPWQGIHKQRLAWGRPSASVPTFFGNRTADHRDDLGNTGTELLTNISVNARMCYGNKRGAPKGRAEEYWHRILHFEAY